MRNSAQETVTVIYVVGTLRTGGPTLQLLYLITNLDRTRFKPIVLVTSASGAATEIERRLAQIGVEVIRIEAGKIVSMIKAPHLLVRIARREAVIVLHPYGFRSDIISWLSRIRPRLGNVRNHTRQNCRQSYGTVRGSLVATIYLILMRTADSVVSCSASVKTDLEKTGQDSIVIRNAIDPLIYRSMLASERASGPATKPIPRYITVASSIPGKNVEFLIREFAQAPAGRRKLIVIGKAKAETVTVYESNANVEFRGYVAKPADAILDADYFISASEHEGMPNAVLEALALGRPVVLSKIPSHLEILTSTDRDIGTTFNWDSSSLEAALNRIETKDYAALCENCLDTSKLQFDVSAMVAAYQKVYYDLVQKSEIGDDKNMKGIAHLSSVDRDQ